MCLIFLNFGTSRYWTLVQYSLKTLASLFPLDVTTLVLMKVSGLSVKSSNTGCKRELYFISRFQAIRVAIRPARMSHAFHLPGDGCCHCGRLDLPAPRVFRHTQKNRAAFQINGPCSAFKAEDRLRTETGDSHILKSQLSPGFHARSYCRVLVDAIAD